MYTKRILVMILLATATWSLPQVASRDSWNDLYTQTEHMLANKGSVSLIESNIKALRINANKFGGKTYLNKVDRLNNSLNVRKALNAGDLKEAERIIKIAGVAKAPVLPAVRKDVQNAQEGKPLVLPPAPTPPTRQVSIPPAGSTTPAKPTEQVMIQEEEIISAQPEVVPEKQVLPTEPQKKPGKRVSFAEQLEQVRIIPEEPEETIVQEEIAKLKAVEQKLQEALAMLQILENKFKTTYLPTLTQLNNNINTTQNSSSLIAYKTDLSTTETELEKLNEQANVYFGNIEKLLYEHQLPYPPRYVLFIQEYAAAYTQALTLIRENRTLIAQKEKALSASQSAEPALQPERERKQEVGNKEEHRDYMAKLQKLHEAIQEYAMAVGTLAKSITGLSSKALERPKKDLLVLASAQRTFESDLNSIRDALERIKPNDQQSKALFETITTILSSTKTKLAEISNAITAEEKTAKTREATLQPSKEDKPTVSREEAREQELKQLAEELMAPALPTTPPPALPKDESVEQIAPQGSEVVEEELLIG